MDHDKGFFTREITLFSHPEGGHRKRLVLPCRWVEYVQNYDASGTGAPFFKASVEHTLGLSGTDWHILAFTGANGEQHQYVVRDAKEVKPNVVVLMEAGSPRRA